MIETDWMDRVSYGQDPDKATLGDILVSVETQDPGTTENGFLAYIKENPGRVLECLKSLPPLDQDLILSYYWLHRSQYACAAMFGEAQSKCSKRLKSGVEVVCHRILFGPPTRKKLEEILKITQKTKISGYPAAEILIEFAQCGSYRKMEKYHITRPQIKRFIWQVAERIEKRCNSTENRALIAWLLGLLQRAAKQKHWGTRVVEHPDYLGDFTLRIEDIDAEQVFPVEASY